jgi:hypothetical protein
MSKNCRGMSVETASSMTFYIDENYECSLREMEKLIAVEQN